MNERFRQLRKQLGLNQTEFAERIGAKQTTVAGWETGKKTPSAPLIVSVCKEFNVREEWLRNGTGEMFKSTDRYDEIAMLTRKLLREERDSFKNRFISILANLTENEWEILEDKLEQLFNATQN